jgi:hypothetical protein
MNDLIEFIKARLHDDERTAREAGTTGPSGPAMFVIDDDYAHDTVAISADRVLAEVDAKRRVLGEMQSHLADDETDQTAQWFVKIMAVPYAGHPDYRQEWAP